MSKKYIVHGAKAKCTMGSMDSNVYTLNGHGMTYHEKPLLNANDHLPMTNIMCFGTCTMLHGPCVPATMLAWQNGNEKFMLDGAPALTDKSCCVCCAGGLITIVSE